jgi:hypothetical protein
LIAGRLPGDRPEVCFPGVSELAFRYQLAGPPKRGQQGGFVTHIAVELRLLRLLFGAEGHLAAQAGVAIEPQLQRAGTILEKFVDDGAFARTGSLEEGDLLLRLEGDDLAQIVTCDRGFTHDVRRALLQDLATGAEVGRKKLPGVAGFQALPRLRGLAVSRLPDSPGRWRSNRSRSCSLLSCLDFFHCRQAEAVISETKSR